MTLIKLFILIFVSFALSRVVLRYKEAQIKTGTLFFWIIIWTGTLFFVFYPNVSDRIANKIGLSRGTDTLFFLGIMISFYLIFKIYVKISEVDKNLTDLTVNASKKFHLISHRRIYGKTNKNK